tara:strand:+ start:4030 stop:4233 length:204 start_codon:yes stop_codon:yes gene_type:complete
MNALLSVKFMILKAVLYNKALLFLLYQVIDYEHCYFFAAGPKSNQKTPPLSIFSAKILGLPRTGKLG